jgi:hypothetical protein
MLRCTDDVKTWRAVLFAMLCCDIIHLYGMWVTGGREFMLDPLGRWRVQNWIDVCVLAVGAGLRVCFLAGVGVGSRRGRTGMGRGRE